MKVRVYNQCESVKTIIQKYGTSELSRQLTSNQPIMLAYKIKISNYYIIGKI